MVKAYKHVRDAIVDGTPIDPVIQDLVNVIPHREYRDGFLFHSIKDFPDNESAEFSWEETSASEKVKEKSDQCECSSSDADKDCACHGEKTCSCS